MDKLTVIFYELCKLVRIKHILYTSVFFVALFVHLANFTCPLNIKKSYTGSTFSYSLFRSCLVFLIRSCLVIPHLEATLLFLI